MYEEVTFNRSIMAIIIRENYSQKGVKFFTPDGFSQQLAFMKHQKGNVIDPHVHNPVHREVHLTQEVLFVKSGRLKVNFYDDDKNYLESRTLSPGDVILLAGGGHGFEVLEDLEMIEVKQGPYAGEDDKTKFNPKKENA